VTPMITRTLSSTCLAVLLLADVSVAQTKPAATPATTAASKPAAPNAPAPAPAAKAAPAAAATSAAAKDAKGASGKDALKDTATIEPQGFSYNAEGRRDPFVSLSRRGADERSNNGPRASGLAGIASSEVSLKGTLISRGGYVGILQGLDNRSYIVRVGDKLLDGSVRSISADGMVILQQVNDPLSLEKEREVRKLLRQTEEAK
jgi:Tfp pilus assembly protein PilP